MEKVFLKLDGVRGESKAPRHIGEIEIYSFSWDAQSSPSKGSGGGAGREQASRHNLTILKPFDSTTATLQLAAANSKIFANARLAVEKISPSGGLLSSTVVNLYSVILTSVTTNGSLDTIGINFGSVRMGDPKPADTSPRNRWDDGLRIGG